MPGAFRALQYCTCKLIYNHYQLVISNKKCTNIKYSLKNGNQSSPLFHFVWIKALSCEIRIKDTYKFYEPVRSQSSINEFFIPPGELFPLNHLPLTSAEQNDCEAEENSTIRLSHVGERPTNKTEI